MISLNCSDNGSIALCKQILSSYPSALHRALSRSISDASKACRAQINREVLARYDISRSNLKDTYTVRTVTPKQEGAVDRGGLVVSSHRIPVVRFNTVPQDVPSQKGIPVNRRQILSTIVVRGQQITARPNRFLAKMASSHLGVFHRLPGTKNRAGTGEQIQEEFRVSVSEMIGGKNIRPKIEKRTGEVFQARVQYHTMRELKKISEKAK
jgi:hypothetical protein